MRALLGRFWADYNTDGERRRQAEYPGDDRSLQMAKLLVDRVGRGGIVVVVAVFVLMRRMLFGVFAEGDRAERVKIVRNRHGAGQGLQIIRQGSFVPHV